MQPLCAQYHHGQAWRPSRTRPYTDYRPAGAPILSCVSKGVPGIFMDCHMMVAQPEKARNSPHPTAVR